jgi:hypothetical protein
VNQQQNQPQKAGEKTDYAVLDTNLKLIQDMLGMQGSKQTINILHGSHQ